MSGTFEQDVKLAKDEILREANGGTVSIVDFLEVLDRTKLIQTIGNESIGKLVEKIIGWMELARDLDAFGLPGQEGNTQSVQTYLNNLRVSERDLV